MRMKTLFDDSDNIDLFVAAVMFLGKQSDRVVFCFGEEILCMLIEKPYIWIELNLESIASSYIFDGMAFSDQDDSRFIYLDVRSSTILSIFGSLLGSAELLDMRLGKKTTTVLKFEANLVERNGRNQMSFEIPAVFLPRHDWTTSDLRRGLEFDASCTLPGFAQLKRYFDVFKQFTHLRFMYDNGELAIEGELEECRMRTVFTKATLSGSQDSDEEKVKCQVLVASKAFVNFLQTMASLRFCGAEITCSLANERMLKLSFVIPAKNVLFSFVLEHIEIEETTHADNTGANATVVDSDEENVAPKSKKKRRVD